MKLTEKTLQNKLIFLGTAGARYVAFGFLRQAGGLYFNFNGYNVHVDPGPGAFVYAHKKGIELHKTNAVILSHRHLDHCADVNHVLEAMTLGGKRKRGKLICPRDALEIDPVVLQFTKGNVEETVVIEEGLTVELTDSLSVSFPVRHVHGVETYGMVFNWKVRVGYVADTDYFEGLEEKYAFAKDLLILNVTMREENPLISHLCVLDAVRIINRVKPRLAILTHFGRTMLMAKPWEVAKMVSEKTGVKVVAAYDNMIVDLETLQIVKQR